MLSSFLRGGGKITIARASAKQCRREPVAPAECLGASTQVVWHTMYAVDKSGRDRNNPAWVTVQVI